jgi:hypothetical protein
MGDGRWEMGDWGARGRVDEVGSRRGGRRSGRVGRWGRGFGLHYLNFHIFYDSEPCF